MTGHEMPRPGEGHGKMLAFTGSWIGNETIHPTPWKPVAGEAVGAMNCEMGIDGFFLTLDYQQTQDGKVAYYGHGVIGFDPASGEHLMWWFDSMGGNPSGASRGTWEGNTIAFVSSSPNHHGRYTYTFQEDDTIDFKLEISEDGETWNPYLDGTYRREGADG